MIRFLRGLKPNLPLTGTDAESLYITLDTNEVYQSTGDGKPLANLSSIIPVVTLPETGIKGKLYITDADEIFRWNGTKFVPVSNNKFTATSVDELQNKTIDATKNTISNLDLTNLKASAVSTDVTLAEDSTTKVVTEHVVKAYVDGVLATVSFGDLGGDLDASKGAFPADSKKGWYYPVSVAGTIDGVDLSIGDLVIARKDNASTVSKEDWIKIDNTEAQDILRTGSISKETDLSIDPTKLADRQTIKAAIEKQLTWETF